MSVEGLQINWLKMLEVAMGVVLLGGGAAFTGGKLAANAAEAKVEAHEKDGVIHTEAARRLDSLRSEVSMKVEEVRDTAQRAADAARDAAYEAKVARTLIEHMMRVDGYSMPRDLPVRPTPAASAAASGVPGGR